MHKVGGPTAVVNESPFGFLDEAVKDHEVYGALDGLQGLAENRLVPLGADVVRRHWRARSTPPRSRASKREIPPR